MKIVLLQDDFPPESFGGAGLVVAQTAEALAARGHEVRIIAATQRRDRAGAGEWRGLPVVRLYSAYHERWRAWRSLYNPRLVREVRALFSEWRPDVVHAHNIHAHLSYASLLEGGRVGAKLFLTAHDVMLVSYGKVNGDSSAWEEFRRAPLRYNPFRNWYIRRVARRLDGVFAVSHALQRLLLRGGIERVSVLYNGIDVSVWQSAPEETARFKSLHGLEERLTLFFGGRLSPQKGAEAMLAALPAIVRAVPNVLLLAAGTENEYSKDLFSRAREKELGANVKFVGWLTGTELRAAYAASTVVMQPSIYFEPFGLIALEGMACGKPVIAGSMGGLSEVVADGETGYIVDPQDTARLSSRVIELLRDLALAGRMGSAGRKRAQEKFSLHAHIDALVTSYEAN